MKELERLGAVLHRFGIDPNLVIPPTSPFVEVRDSSELETRILKMLGASSELVERVKAVKELEMTLQKGIRRAPRYRRRGEPKRVWVRDPRVRTGGYWAIRYTTEPPLRGEEPEPPPEAKYSPSEIEVLQDIMSGRRKYWLGEKGENK